MGARLKAQSAPKIREKMQKVECKAQMHDAKLEQIFTNRLNAECNFQA
jgi:hypothetical protein